VTQTTTEIQMDSAAYAAPEPRRWAVALKRRWPTWLAIALALWTAGDDPDSRTGLSEALLLFALGYLAAAALQQRQATWLIASLAIGALAALRLQDWADPSLVLLIAALALVVWAAVHGQLWPPGAVMFETVGVVGFGAIALLAMSLDYQLGGYLLAAGWFAHAAWDFAHYRADKVVSRSFAEWCAVFDALGAVGILIVTMRSPQAGGYVARWGVHLRFVSFAARCTGPWQRLGQRTAPGSAICSSDSQSLTYRTRAPQSASPNHAVGCHQTPGRGGLARARLMALRLAVLAWSL